MLDFQGFRKSLGVGVVPGDFSKVRGYLLGAQLRSSRETSLEELERLVFQTEPKAVSAETAPGVLDLLTKTEELQGFSDRVFFLTVPLEGESSNAQEIGRASCRERV